MAIEPIKLPTAAGVDYGSGDVRHFAQGDAMDVPGVSNPTRQLAERDNLLAEKLNEVVSTVNNTEQFVPLPLMRTLVPPGQEIIVTNYRIPAGFEARVLNSAISASPASTEAELNLYYNGSFGGSSGTAVVTVTPASEFTGEVSFHPEGEFVVSLKNTGSRSLELAASIILTMRPLGAEGTLLVGSVIQGQRGPVGQRGAKGEKGADGSGVPGAPGMNWKGAWTAGASYVPTDTVSYAYSGTYGSWICRLAHVASAGLNDPQVDTTTWNPVAYGVAVAGTAGSTGPAGGEAQFSDTLVNGRIVTAATYGTNPYSSEYTAGVVSQPNTTYTVQAREVAIYNSTGTVGVALLTAAYRTCFKGSISFLLPQITDGAAVNYTTSNISLTVTAHGTVVSNGTSTISSVSGGTNVKTIEQVTYTSGYGINVISPDCLPLSIIVHGVQSVP